MLRRTTSLFLCLSLIFLLTGCCMRMRMDNPEVKATNILPVEDPGNFNLRLFKYSNLDQNEQNRDTENFFIVNQDNYNEFEMTIPQNFVRSFDYASHDGATIIMTFDNGVGGTGSISRFSGRILTVPSIFEEVIPEDGNGQGSQYMLSGDTSCRLRSIKIIPIP